MPFSDDIPNIEDIFNEKLASLEERDSDFDLHSHSKVKEIAEKVWHIHHQGQPMPRADNPSGEDEDIIVSQVQHCSRLNLLNSLTPRVIQSFLTFDSMDRTLKCDHSLESG